MAANRSAKAAASRQGAAAKAEADNEPHEIEFIGLKLELPAKLRESIIWRFGVIRDGDVRGAARVVEALIGPDQFSQVLDAMDEQDMFVDADADTSPMTELLEKAMAAYGLSAGESSASNGS